MTIRIIVALSAMVLSGQVCFAQDRLVAMVSIKAGHFRMGDSSSAETRPVRDVTITRDFLIGKYEVTNAQYCQIINYLIDQGEYRADEKAIWNLKTRQYRLLFLDQRPFYHQFGIEYHAPHVRPRSGREDQPLAGITWLGALEFCNALSRMESLP